MTYEAQLRLKEKQLRDKLERIYGGEAPAPEPIIGMEDPWHYRNKGQYAVYAGAALVNKDGSVRNAERPRVGFYDGREAEYRGVQELSDSVAGGRSALPTRCGSISGRRGFRFTMRRRGRAVCVK